MIKNISKQNFINFVSQFIIFSQNKIDLIIDMIGYIMKNFKQIQGNKKKEDLNFSNNSIINENNESIPNGKPKKHLHVEQNNIPSNLIKDYKNLKLNNNSVNLKTKREDIESDVFEKTLNIKKERCIIDKNNNFTNLFKIFEVELSKYSNLIKENLKNTLETLRLNYFKVKKNKNYGFYSIFSFR